MTERVVLTAAGALTLLYGFLVFRIGSGSRFWMVWAAAGAALLLLGRLFPRLPETHPRVLLLLRTGAAAAAAVLVFLTVLIAGSAHAAAPGDLDCLIVLGAQVREDGPAVVLRYRLDRAAEYLADHPRTFCVVSGGQGSNEPLPEADVMRDYLIGKGIGEDRIRVERKSRNTAENIRLSRALLGGEALKTGIVTNDFHVFRAVRIAKRQELREVYGVPAGSTPLYLPNNVLRECLGILKDLAAGNLRLFDH